MEKKCNHCEKNVYAKGLCSIHYQKLRKYGDPLAGRSADETLLDRITRQLSVGDCWEWTGALYDGGYGQISVIIDGKKTTRVVHRTLWTLLVGELSDDVQLDHRCRNRKCANPDHLEPVTAKVNTERGFGLAWQMSQRTHCKHGHEFTPENTRWDKQRGSQLRRTCKTCDRIKSKQARERNKLKTERDEAE